MTFYLRIARVAAALVLILASTAGIGAQEPSTKPTPKPVDKSAAAAQPPDKATIPFQIQLLETHIRFEANGDSRKEVHTIVKLNNAVGAHEFSKIAFDYNRTFQQVEIPMVRITHANGGTSDVLPSAVTDTPNPAVEKYPAYQDVRVKSVRILGLQEGDLVEYRVVTATTHAPLAPNFWLEHSFDHSGEVLEEKYAVEVPTSNKVNVWTSAAAKTFESTQTGDGATATKMYSWNISGRTNVAQGIQTPNKEDKEPDDTGKFLTDSDVAISTYESWAKLGNALQKLLGATTASNGEIKTKAQELTQSAKNPRDKLPLLYTFVAQKVAPVDLPLGATGFAPRSAAEILSSSYATPEDKAVLLAALARAIELPAKLALTGPNLRTTQGLILPSKLTNILVVSSEAKKNIWLDPSEGVTPFGMIAANLRGKPALLPGSTMDAESFEKVTRDLPFAAFQKVGVNATLSEDGKLSAKVKYTLRGDNELLLRMAFHQTPKEKWKDVAGLLALSDGFRGVITSVNASDPMATKYPFTVEYELTQAKFVDWAKKPVRIPALLPQIGLPDPAERTGGKIELGTPLDVETQVSLHLPAGTKVQAPAGTAVERDYATYSSKYGSTADTLTALRHIHFLLREIPGGRAPDYQAFERVVQNDQSQYFVLDSGVGVKAAALP